MAAGRSSIAVINYGMNDIGTYNDTHMLPTRYVTVAAAPTSSRHLRRVQPEATVSRLHVSILYYG